MRFTAYRFGPPLRFTATSPCPWIAHLASGLHILTLRPFQARFHFGFASPGLTSPIHAIRGHINQKARGHSFELPLLVGLRFQVLFHSPPGVLFTFPSRYFSAIGRRVVFSLGWWSTLIHAGFLVSHATWDSNPEFRMYFAYGTFTLSGLTSQSIRLYILPLRASCSRLRLLPATPCRQRPHPFTPTWFWLFPFRSPLLRESLLISFPPGTKMFPFPGFASLSGFSGCPIRISTDLRSLAAPRGFSQLATSFFASRRLGIRRKPFLP